MQSGLGLGLGLGLDMALKNGAASAPASGILPGSTAAGPYTVTLGSLANRRRHSCTAIGLQSMACT